MAQDVVPKEVRDFIDKHIDSVSQLEALLLLRRNPELKWDAPGTANRLYISEQEAAAVLAKLSAEGLLVAEEGGRYRFGCRTAESHELVDRLAGLYARHLIPVTKLIHSKPDRIQQFADAFKLRRES